MKALIAVAFTLAAGVSTTCLATTRTATLIVPGMTCPTCPITVKKSLERVPGVSHIASDYAKKTVTVSYDDTRASPAALTKATADAGYPSTLKQ
jgi:mercuric ion binding protein